MNFQVSFVSTKSVENLGLIHPTSIQQPQLMMMMTMTTIMMTMLVVLTMEMMTMTMTKTLPKFSMMMTPTLDFWWRTFRAIFPFCVFLVLLLSDCELFFFFILFSLRNHHPCFLCFLVLWVSHPRIMSLIFFSHLCADDIVARLVDSAVERGVEEIEVDWDGHEEVDDNYSPDDDEHNEAGSDDFPFVNASDLGLDDECMIHSCLSLSFGIIVHLVHLLSHYRYLSLAMLHFIDEF